MLGLLPCSFFKFLVPVSCVMPLKMSSVWVVAAGGAVVAAAWYLWPRSKKPDASRRFNVLPNNNSEGGHKSLKDTVGGGSSQSAAEAEEDDGKPVCMVLYGSQTGTAEEFSERIGTKLRHYGFRDRVVDMEDVETEDLADVKLGIFMVATYGEGEPTDNAMEMYNYLLHKSTDPELLSGMKYTVFGLGNKTYKHYNEMGRFYDKRLGELGATRVYEYGEGDDDANLEDDFIAWDRGLYKALAKEVGLDISGVGNPEDAPIQYAYGVVFHSEDDMSEAGPPSSRGRKRASSFVFGSKRVYTGRITEARDLHKEKSPRACYHVEVDISGHRVNYDAGDHIAVYPYNDPDTVAALAARLGYDLNQGFTMVPLETAGSNVKKLHYPPKITIETALTNYTDIQCNPGSQVLRALSQAARDPEEAKTLHTMASSEDEGRKLFAAYHAKGQDLLGVLKDFPSVQIPLENLLEVIPALQPRYYSISSSGKVHKETVHITCALVDETMPTGRNLKGVASSYLARSSGGDKIHFSLRRSPFHLPRRPNIPVIMVGPGTGFAPFRGFLQQLSAAGEKDRGMLFFGCRHPEEDYIYEEELAQYKEEGIVSVHVAFSRLNPEKKHYVQHLLEEQGEQVYHYLQERNAWFYVCGDKNHMAKDVDAALHKVIAKHGNMNEDQAKDFVNNLVKNGRYMQDVW